MKTISLNLEGNNLIVTVDGDYLATILVADNQTLIEEIREISFKSDEDCEAVSSLSEWNTKSYLEIHDVDDVEEWLKDFIAEKHFYHTCDDSYDNTETTVMLCDTDKVDDLYNQCEIDRIL